MIREFLRRNATWIVIVLALILIAVSGVPVDQPEKVGVWLKSLLPTLGWFILGTGVVNYLYELHGKQEIVRQIKALVNISDSMDESGIQKATLEIGDISWKALISTAKNIDLSVSYANTWRSNYVGQLKEFARNKSSRLRVLLPDPEDERLMIALGLRYNRSAEDVSKSVKEACQFFEDIFREINASKRCSVIFSSKESTYAYHRFDDVCVVTLYHGLGRIGKVATLQFGKNGAFGKLFCQDFENSVGSK
ncbi:hypothetical protein HDC36_003318 [Xanthomonas sp. JAI131]|uniref:hypothetical protein n=1 Tax=Xanthomonas sp. JAI131 TaxID=2723067 RepID=UPI0015C78DC5|nr:hypothetical protein [Xanthomonas sp. JAI131]NYF21842.1 hypothetical protein [Xanthomonas sp. JAI131]